SKTAPNLNLQPSPQLQPVLQFAETVAEQLLTTTGDSFKAFFEFSFLPKIYGLQNYQDGRLFWVKVFRGVLNYLNQNREDSEARWSTVYANIEVCFQSLQMTNKKILTLSFLETVLDMFHYTALCGDDSERGPLLKAALWTESWTVIDDLFQE